MIFLLFIFIMTKKMFECDCGVESRRRRVFMLYILGGGKNSFS